MLCGIGINKTACNTLWLFCINQGILPYTVHRYPLGITSSYHSPILRPVYTSPHFNMHQRGPDKAHYNARRLCPHYTQKTKQFALMSYVYTVTPTKAKLNAWADKSNANYTTNSGGSEWPHINMHYSNVHSV